LDQRRPLYRCPAVVRSYTTTARPPSAGRCELGQAARHSIHRPSPTGTPLMKIVLWIIFIIFLIGLAVVLGLGKLIF
jgi:hypothetical protein